MTIFKCKMCGADLPLIEGSNVCECEYCGTTQTVPTADNDKKMNLFNRANRLRFANEFDKAAGVFESIVSEFPEEAEAYWGLCLCKYGIEYVDDPATARKIPTCHRTSYDSIFDDGNFEMAQEYADVVARKVYRDEAKEIDRLQKSILEIAKHEEPFDIFICYKETANDGQRTIDSVLAQDIYDNLTEKGYKVFFARITLEDKIGQEYEPYIFSALSSAKVMLVIGTDYEYFNAVWVKNEWSRFLDMMKSDKKKTLIPCYKDIDAYDIPNEFRHLQAQDMGKVGFMQDLIRGIGKIIHHDTEQPSVQTQNTVVVQQTSQSATIDSLLERAFMFLEDGEWEAADRYCDKVLDIEPKCARAYVVKLLAERKLRTQAELHFSKSRNADRLFTDPIENNANYKKALRFAAPDLKRELEKDSADNSEEYDRRRYEEAVAAMNAAVTDSDFNSTAKLFDNISGYRDSIELAKQCRENAKEYLYPQALSEMDSALTEEQFLSIAAKLEKLGNYRDSAELLRQCKENAEFCRNNMVLRLLSGKVGVIIKFGKYEWYIIRKSNNTVTLLCKDIVAKKPYSEETDDITWEKCTLRKWLNEDFYSGFTDEEKAMIARTKCENKGNSKYGTNGGHDTEDYIFLLSIDEAGAVNESMRAVGSWWWLRSPGKYQSYAAFVNGVGNGSLDDHGFDVNSKYGVLPALNLEFKSFNPTKIKNLKDFKEEQERQRIEQEERQRLEQERQRLEQERQRLEKEAQQRKQRINHLTRTIAAKRTEISELDSTLSTHRTNLRQQQSIYTANAGKLFGKKKAQAAQAEINRLNNEISKAEQKKTGLESQLSKLESELKELESQN